MVLYVAGDIGGTNSRLQLFDYTDRYEQLLSENTYPSKKYNSMVEILNIFIQACYKTNKIHKSTPIIACTLAVAGPVNHNTVRLTNLNWVINGDEIESKCHIRKCMIVNDFAGIGYGLLDLKPYDYIQLNPDIRPILHAPKSCLGAGTGLGECYLTYNGKEYDVWSCEGGHTDYPPRNDLEYELLQYIKAHHNIDGVSIERVVSGMGLTNIYDFLAQKYGNVHGDVLKEIEAGNDKNAVITTYALSQQCNICIQSVDLFMSLYGAEAGNLALKTLPFGGIYIAGGIASKIMWSLFKNNQFYNSFISKGRMSTVLQQVPIYIVTAPQIGLLGSRVLCKRIVRDYNQQNSSKNHEHKLIHSKL